MNGHDKRCRCKVYLHAPILDGSILTQKKRSININAKETRYIDSYVECCNYSISGSLCCPPYLFLDEAEAESYNFS